MWREDGRRRRLVIGEFPGDGDCALHSVKRVLPTLTDAVADVRANLASHLLADLQELELYAITVAEYERKGEDIEDALSKAERKLRRRFGKYRRTGPRGEEWINNKTVVGLARHYHMDGSDPEPRRELDGR